MNSTINEDIKKIKDYYSNKKIKILTNYNYKNFNLDEFLFNNNKIIVKSNNFYTYIELLECLGMDKYYVNDDKLSQFLSFSTKHKYYQTYVGMFSYKGLKNKYVVIDSSTFLPNDKYYISDKKELYETIDMVIKILFYKDCTLKNRGNLINYETK